MTQAAAAPAAPDTPETPAAAPAAAVSEFDAAFAELSAATPATPTAVAAPVETPPETPPTAAETPPVAVAETPPPAAPAGETDPPPAVVAETPPAAAPDAAALQARIAELEAQAAERAKAAPGAAPPAAPAVEPPPAPPLYSDEEKTALGKYHEEWPDVAKGEALARRAEYGQLVKYIFDQIRPELEALRTFSESASTRTQYQDIVELVPDYDAVRDKVLSWIDTQPEYLKNAYSHVTENGTPKDVADLITRFKKETGAAPAPTAAPNTPAAPAAPAALPAAAAAAVPSLRVVKTGRTEPPPVADPNDFDAAFKEFANAS